MIMTFLEVASTVVTWWVTAFLHSDMCPTLIKDTSQQLFSKSKGL